MGLEFEWDANKARLNRLKHRVPFEEASSVFADPLSLSVDDPMHSTGKEERCVTLGRSTLGRLLVVVHCDRGDRIRIISARKATPRERGTYEERD